MTWEQLQEKLNYHYEHCKVERPDSPYPAYPTVTETNIGRCLTETKCTKCGLVYITDSSD